MTNRRVGILMGGWSGERDVSLKTGEGVARALESRGHRVVAYERFGSLYELPRAVYFDDEIMHVWQMLGIVDAISQPYEIDGYRLSSRVSIGIAIGPADGGNADDLLMAAGRLSYWDAMVVTAARDAGCDLLLSEDLHDGARFGSLVGIAHSAQSVSERWASWMAAIGGQARVMIGPRSVIFASEPRISVSTRR